VRGASVHRGFTVGEAGDQRTCFGSESLPGVVGQRSERGGLDPVVDGAPDATDVTVDEQGR